MGSLRCLAIHHVECRKAHSIRHNDFNYVQLHLPFIILPGSRPCLKKKWRWNLKAALCLAQRCGRWHTVWLWVRERIGFYFKCHLSYVFGWSLFEMEYVAFVLNHCFGPSDAVSSSPSLFPHFPLKMKNLSAIVASARVAQLKTYL